MIAWKLRVSFHPKMPKSIYTDEYQHFLSELKEARVRADVTQEQLAESLGEHQTFVSKVERGVRRIDVVELRLWLAALNTSFPDFCSQLDSRLARHIRASIGAHKKAR